MTSVSAIEKAAERARRAQWEADTLTAFAPHLDALPLPLARVSADPYGLWGAIVTACFKLRTVAELTALIDALPPVPCIAARGTFASVKPVDKVEERDCTRSRDDADGVTLRVQKSATTGAYPCDEHAMSAQWFSDTPAGRVHVRVDFHHNTREDWPTVAVTYEVRTGQRGGRYYDYESKEISSCRLDAQPPHSEAWTFGSHDARKEPASYLVWWRDAESRRLSLEAMA